MPQRRQIPPKNSPGHASALEQYDQAINVLADIETLAKLLESVGSVTNAEPVDATLVSMAGAMIARRTEALRKVLRSGLQTEDE